MGHDRRSRRNQVLTVGVGTWADNRDRILAAVEDLPDLPWAVRLVVDQDGQDTGFAWLRGQIDEEDREAFDEVAATHRLIGTMQWWGFPLAEYSWGADGYEVTPDRPLANPWSRPEIAACEAWTCCARDPARYLPPTTPRFMISESDFVDTDAVWEAAYGPWSDPLVPKRWDVICAFDGDRAHEVEGNWGLARRCLERLAGDQGLSVLLVGRSGMPDIPDLPTVEVRPDLSWDESVGCLARSRLALFANHMDPSPQFMTEALATGVPVLAHSGLLGGWHYVQPETGRFFDSESDVAVAALRCLSTDYDTRSWLDRSFGRDRSARALADFLRGIGGPSDLRYALPTTLFR